MPSMRNAVSSVRPSLKRREAPFRRLYADYVHEKPREHHEQTVKLLKACAGSDVKTVRKLLDDEDCPSYDSRDTMGRTPLQLAVENEDTEIIKLLMPKYRRQNDNFIIEALLDSLEDENESVALMIVNDEVFMDMEKLKKGEKDEKGLSFEIAPILLAAQKEMYEVVNLFTKRDYRIEKPHPLNCNCVNCWHSISQDPFRFAQQRLNLYRGLASVSYIALTEEDPVLRAITLRQEILATGNVERYLKAEYEGLANHLSTFLVNLLDKVCDTDELDVMLHRSEKPDEHEWKMLARVKFALENGEKMFIAHPSCQLQISNAFFKGFRSTQKAPVLKRFILVLIFLISYPALAFTYILFPGAEKLRIIKAPISKFISHTFFYLLMLVFVVGSTIDVNAATEEKFQVPRDFNTTGFFKLVNSTTDMYYVRSSNMNITQMLILAWVVGLIWQEIKEIYVFSFWMHVSSFLNWLDLFMLLAYVISYALRIFTLIRVRSAVSYYQSDPNHFILLNDSDTTAVDHQYWINADRFYWNQTDFLVLAELVFSVANVLSFARILNILPFSEVLGPLQISFGLMIKDIIRFLGLFFLVFLAFGVGLTNVYWFYDEFTRTSVALAEHGKSQAELHYAGIVDSYKSCFWSIFGMLDPASPDLNGFTGKNTSLVQVAGFVIYGAFMVATIIILFNLLIAMMTSTYEKLSADVTVEWKFVRAELFFYYMHPGFTLPAPLNLIPTPKSVFYLLRWIFCCRWEDKDSGTVTPENADAGVSSMPHGQTTGSEPKKNKKKSLFHKGSVITYPVVKFSYKDVIGRVVSRFIRDGYLRKSDMKADLENLRQDMFRLRHQVSMALEKQSPT